MNKLAIVFPGQGSQSLGMLSELSQNHQIFRDTFSEASEVVGYDLWSLTVNGPLDKLNETFRTQPILLASSVAIWRVWKHLNKPMPDYLAGHSLGEYSALVCADSISFKDGIALVEQRGRFMQEAVPAGVGAMSAIIGLSTENIMDACNQASNDKSVVAPVNFNAPGQIVIAGNIEAVEKANKVCKEMGAKRALMLPVSVPSHCILMKPAAEKLIAELDKIEFLNPKIPVIQNYDCKSNTEIADIKQSLIKQLYNPVRWIETIELLASCGVDSVVEMGPGKVLTGLNKRIAKELNLHAVNDLASLNSL
ncbi:[acyl-carrier-protein] S-malonyltransferase [Paraphotobacterium marinum]|uniref:Malonyl CoA-acyl carrier protein transacylase n=1 Tax=Paraphotobacterium marinum TaxID=1755811 RepID=A0A220VBS9_9GAMM|nr:ACP S-malonyltransferase [Paraphotobacterium marinum]ASK77666.1 [acyl-carrier-protein] S-malonyltransferase [Paraphotobacterium marinum]